MLALASLLAAEASKHSKVAFYIAGCALAGFAIVLSAVGITRHGTFPPTDAAARAVAGICILLVAAAVATAVITA